MPIVTRTLESVQQSGGGTVLASFLAVDGKGREWRRSRARFASEASAVVVSNAFDWTLQLKGADFVDLLAHVETPVKGDPSTFNLTNRDITLIEAEDFLYKLMAHSKDGSAIKTAWWLKDMNNPTFIPIRNRAGHDNTEGDRVKDKAVAQEGAEPTINDVVEVD